MAKYLDDYRDAQEEEESRPDPTQIAQDAAKMSSASDSTFEAPTEEVLQVPGTVEGWRAWRVDSEPPPFGLPPKLYSASWSFFWKPRTLSRAECSRDPDHVPGETCSCGFYSAKTLRHLQSMGYSNYTPGAPTITVVGRLANWGKVVEGSQGWRAEKAYPVQFYLPFEAHRLAKPIADAYGVPVKLMNLLDHGAKP
jgi:hypothetical protein